MIIHRNLFAAIIFLGYLALAS